MHTFRKEGQQGKVLECDLTTLTTKKNQQRYDAVQEMRECNDEMKAKRLDHDVATC